MPALYVLEWEESEAGWGVRPDGLSLHVDEAAAKQFVRDHWAAQPAGGTPAEYDRPVSERGQLVEASSSLHAQVVAKGGSLRTYQHRVVTSPTGARRLVSKSGYDGDTFMALVAAGRAKLSEVDDYVEKWHAGAGDGAALPAYLGLSDREYAEFVKNPAMLTRLALQRAVAALAPEGHRHLKTNGEYLALGEGKLERDGSPVIVYLGVDGQLWVRATDEFRDGRFAASDSAEGLKLVLTAAS